MSPTDPRDSLARIEPYLPEVREACALEGEQLELVAGIGLRETLFGWARGYDRPGSHLGRGDLVAREWTAARVARTEGIAVLGPGLRYPDRLRVVPADGRGWGWGLYQFDLAGPYAHLPREAPDATPFLQTRWVCAALRDARAELAAELGRDFALSALFEVSVVCCFNAGSPAVVRCLRAGLHPDHATADGPDADHEGDYGSSVLAYRDQLLGLLTGPLPTAPVPPATLVGPGEG